MTGTFTNAPKHLLYCLATFLMLLPVPLHAVVLEVPFVWENSAIATGTLPGLDSTPTNWDPIAGDEPIFGSVLGGAPNYQWYYGCSPTAGGMMIAWWDSQEGLGDLYDGDAYYWNTGTKNMVASPEHIQAGKDLGLTYGSYMIHTANSIADFMMTHNGGTSAYNMARGLELYAHWDNPKTPHVKERHHGYAELMYVPTMGGSFTYSDLVNEIDQGRPMLLNMVSYHNSGWRGHTVFAHGYEVFNGINWVAVRDTWSLSGGLGTIDGSYWRNPDNPAEFVDNRLVGGVEWWPFFEWTGDSGSTDLPDWRVHNAISFEVHHAPEPGAMFLVALGIVFICIKRRQTAKSA